MKLLEVIKEAEAAGKGSGKDAKRQRQIAKWLKELYALQEQRKTVCVRTQDGDWIVPFLPNPIHVRDGWYFHSVLIRPPSPFAVVYLQHDDGATAVAKFDLARRAFLDSLPALLTWVPLEELHHRTAEAYRYLERNRT